MASGTTSAYAPRIAPGAGRRPQAARLLARSGVLRMLPLMRSLVADDVRILAYHRVLETIDAPGFSFDIELVSASAEAFRQQMLLVRRRYHPMRFDELLDCLDRGRRVPPRAILVSFDDGYDDNHRVAFPILRELGMSGMFFVSTGHITSRHPFDYDWLVHMLCHAGSGHISVPSLGPGFVLPVDLDGRRVVARELLTRIKSLDGAAQVVALADLERELGLPRPDRHADCLPMAWPQLVEMVRGGMEVGSHGVRHRMLAKLPEAELRDELQGSKDVLERELGVAVQVLSYPVGGSDSYDQRVIDAARAAGYRMACTYQSGMASADPSARYRMARLPIERYNDLPWFEAIVALPELFSYPATVRAAATDGPGCS